MFESCLSALGAYRRLLNTNRCKGRSGLANSEVVPVLWTGG